MNIRKIWITSGILVLTAAAVFASSKKRSSSVFTVYYTKVGYCHTVVAPGGQFTNSSIGGQQAAIITYLGSVKSLYSTCITGLGATNPVYFIP